MKYYIAINKQTGKAYAGRDWNTTSKLKTYATEITPPHLFPQNPPLALENDLLIRDIDLDKFDLVEVDIPFQT